MLVTTNKSIDLGGNNYLKIQDVSLESDMKAVILLSVKDKNLLDLLYNKILDVLIDRIHPKNVYKDFSHALENINAFLKSWQKSEEFHKAKIHGIIGIYAKKNFYFSTVGKASCYLYNTREEVVEVTDKNDTPKDFSFISSGEVADGEVIILSSNRLLDFLAYDDFSDALRYDTLENAGNIIESILYRESEGKNIALGFLSNISDSAPSKVQQYTEKYKYIFYKGLDNKFIKNIFSYYYLLRDKILKKSDRVKQLLLGGGIILGTYVLFSIISGFFQMTSEVGSTQEAREKLLLAQEYIGLASESLNDVDAFEYNIERAEEQISHIESQELYTGDIQQLKNNISLLEKKMNGIEVFMVNQDDIIINYEEQISPAQIVDLAGKKYVIGRNQIIGPISAGQNPEIFRPEDLGSPETFITATQEANSILIMSESGKVIRFENGRFTYVDVTNQDTWDFSPIMENYSRNIYMLSKAGNQILMHRRNGSDYEAGVSYLSDEDAIANGRILDLAIDGGIYILKLDGSMLKLFRSPSYRLESLSLNNLPKNYDFSNIDKNSPPKIYADINLNYVYMLLDNRILIFEPNTRRFQDTKSLTYVGQIEGQGRTIEAIYIENDGEIFISDEQGLFKIEFEVLEDKILVK